MALDDIGFIPAHCAIAHGSRYSTLIPVEKALECALSDIFRAGHIDLKIEPEVKMFIETLEKPNDAIITPSGLFRRLNLYDQLMPSTIASLVSKKRMYTDLSLLLTHVAWCIWRYEATGGLQKSSHVLIAHEEKYNLFFLDVKGHVVPIALQVGVRQVAGHAVSCFRLSIPDAYTQVPTGSAIFYFSPSPDITPSPVIVNQEKTDA